jgi:hypothetical protein
LEYTTVATGLALNINSAYVLPSTVKAYLKFLDAASCAAIDFELIGGKNKITFRERGLRASTRDKSHALCYGQNFGRLTQYLSGCNLHCKCKVESNM